MRCVHPIALLLAVVGASCSGVQRAHDWHEHLGAPEAAVPGSGPFDAMVPDGIWGVGDRVVHVIAVDDGERALRFIFELTTIALPGADRGGLEVVDPVHGRILTRTARVQMSRGTETVASGPARVRARLVGDDGTDCGGELDAELLAHWHADSLESFGVMSGVTELFGALLRLDCMHAALLRVLRPPSAWSVARRLGGIEVALVFAWQRELVVSERDTPFGRLPTMWQPFTITANGQPALDGRIEFTWKHAPLLLGAGVLRVEAWHPDDPTRRLTLHLDSAVRGTPPDAPDPDELCAGLRRGMPLAAVTRTLGAANAEPVECGRLADGTDVDLVVLREPRFDVHTVSVRGELLYAALHRSLLDTFLHRRGYVASR
jgi:hypothetical protein